MPRTLSRALPLLLALLFVAVIVMQDAHLPEAGSLCVIVLISSLGWAFGQIWSQMDGYEKRIRQLEEELAQCREKIAETQRAEGIQLPE